MTNSSNNALLLQTLVATGGSSDAVRMMEAFDQPSFVDSETLPAKMYIKERNALESFGFIFGEIVPENDLLQNVTFPQGWKKTATDNPVLFDLVDEKGRKRSSLFYRNTFHNRGSRLTLLRRFEPNHSWNQRDEGITFGFVTCEGVEIFLTPLITYDKSDSEARDTAESDANKQACDWLDANFPDWENFTAYWD